MSSDTIQVRTHRIDSKHEFKAFYGTHAIDNQSPYFTVTGEIVVFLPGGRQRVEMCGCIHDEVLQYFPDLKPLVDLHLSDENGVPMHALENGWYWAGGTRWNGSQQNDSPNVDFLASHLRISPENAQAIVEAVALGSMDKEAFTAIVEALKPYWHAQANHAVSFLDSGEWPDISPETEVPSLAEFLPSTSPRP